MEDTDIRTVDIDGLVDINSITVERGAKHERLHSFIRQIKNPYCFRVGKTAVKISFSDTNDTLQDKLGELLAKL
ncbi:MAG: hypothetical protein LBB94_10770 [Clostridiales bacterium]|jgi:hypothetical protein|nr:hypothetical protein [Clostridiales bacterium]